MNSTIQTSVKTAKEVKALEVIKTTTMKTKTKLEIRTDEKLIEGIVYLQSVTSDVRLLGIGGEPVTDLMWAIEGAPAIGRIVNRSRHSLLRVGLDLSSLEWEDVAGVVTLKPTAPLYGNDLPVVVEVLFRLVSRACAPIGATQHPLTIYDLKQAMGLVYDLKQGGELAEIAGEIDQWLAVREEAYLADEKAKRAKVVKEKKVEKGVKAKAAPDPQKSTKTKVQPKITKPTTANLGTLE